MSAPELEGDAWPAAPAPDPGALDGASHLVPVTEALEAPALAAVVAPRCPACLAVLRRDASFCGACGARVGASPAPDDAARAEVSDPGLGAALTWYFLTFAAVLVVFAAKLTGTTTLHALDLYLLVLGLAGVALFPRAVGPLFRPPRLTLPGAALTIALTAAIFAVVTALAHVLPAFFVDVTATYKAEGRSLAYTVFDVGVVPGVTEELIFRGVILAGLLRTLSRRAAVVTSALLFATIHVSPLSFVHLGLLGVVLAEVRLRTRSLWPAMLLHTAYNAAIVLFEW